MALIPDIEIDLEGIPKDLIREGIEWQFEFQIPNLDTPVPTTEEYQTWFWKYKNAINSFPDKYRMQILEKGIEYGKKRIEIHKPNCKAKPGECGKENSLNRRIDFAERFLAELKPKEENKKELTPMESAHELKVQELNDLFGYNRKEEIGDYDNITFESLTKKKNESYEKKRQTFINSLTINNPQNLDLELDLDLFRKTWVENQLEHINSLLKNDDGSTRHHSYRYFVDENIRILNTVVLTKYSMSLQAELQKLELKLNQTSIPTEQDETKNKDYSVARQVLAMHYLLEYCKVKNIDNTKKAKFIEFLTGKSYKNVYDAVRSPLKTKEGNFRKEDLQYIRPHFENLGLSEIVKMINNELDKPNT